MKNRRNFFHFIKYILVSLLVFISAVVISIIARMFLVADCLFWGFTEDQASLVTSMLEGVVGAIAAGLVLYQLKLSNDVEERQNSIEEARFILQYNQAFIQDASICKVEQLLEQSMLHEINTPIINQENRQLFINYLVYLEGLAPLILRDVLQLKHVDDLFAYRFFLAINNRELQEKELFRFPEYYRGCLKLYEKWKRYRKQHHFDILLEENSIDKWFLYEKYVDSPIQIRHMQDSDSKKVVARLIYGTDPYIYPAAFGSMRGAEKALPLLMCDHHLFAQNNIVVAEVHKKIVGIAVVLDTPFQQFIDVEQTLAACPALPDSFRHTCIHYFNGINAHLVEENTVYIMCLSVDRKFRKQRIGEILLKHIIHAYPDRKIKLHVLHDNESAVALYKKYGFQISAELQDGYAYASVPPKCDEMYCISPGILKEGKESTTPSCIHT